MEEGIFCENHKSVWSDIWKGNFSWFYFFGWGNGLWWKTLNGGEKSMKGNKVSCTLEKSFSRENS